MNHAHVHFILISKGGQHILTVHLERGSKPGSVEPEEGAVVHVFMKNVIYLFRIKL